VAILQTDELTVASTSSSSVEYAVAGRLEVA